MIVSHEHRFVFVKTRKTAGTSIEVFLSKLAGEDAIVSPIRPAIEGHRPRNYSPPPTAKLLLDCRDPVGGNESADRDVEPRDEIQRDLASGEWYWNHMPARTIRARLGPRRWESYFTFTFERNPWEKAISRYFFEERTNPRGWSRSAFRQFVLSDRLQSDFDAYSLDGVTVAVDFVGRTERLSEDLRQVLERLGIETEVILGREKASHRPPNATVANLFDAETSQRVEQLFAREIAALGFEAPQLK